MSVASETVTPMNPSWPAPFTLPVMRTLLRTISGLVALGLTKKPVSSTPNVRFRATVAAMSTVPSSFKSPPNTWLATSRSAGPSSDLTTCTLKVVTPLTSVKVTLPGVASRASRAARSASGELIAASSPTSSRRKAPNPDSKRRRRKGSPWLGAGFPASSASPAAVPAVP